jgi:hypothetical protein
MPVGQSVEGRQDLIAGAVMRGPSRDQWEHSIPAVDELRYSITFRSLRFSSVA